MPAPAPDHPHHNLPAALSPFIGRRREIAALRARLAHGRLLTLTGPGGSGKTRLALRLAGDAVAGYADGVWLVELAALDTAARIPQAIAAALAVRPRPDEEALQALARHLRPRTLLLLLDNCEHLVEGCAAVSAALLEACPGLTILATSREPLGLPGEVVWGVPPLSLPERRPWRDPDGEEQALAAYAQAEAIQLFVARARATTPAFRLDRENGPWVAAICRRLDGMPLAIELAAARLRTLSTRQIAERLDDRFRLLRGPWRGVPARQRSLEATIDWSYELLTAAEQDLLGRLSVFAGGWTLEAAEAVGAEEGGAVLETLAGLVDKSLVSVDASGDARRYYLLESIRQYAAGKLAAAGQGDGVRDRHLAYYVAWAGRAAPRIMGAEQAVWLPRFEAEYDNLRAALAWSQAGAGAAEAGLRLAAACAYFWKVRGYLAEGRAHLAAALARPGAQARNEARALALLTAANLAYLQSDYRAARALAEEGLAISAALGADGRAARAWAYDILGELATEVGEYAQATPLLERSLALYREIGDRRGTAELLMQLGWTAMREGEYASARPLLEESLPLLRDLGEARLLGQALSGLGELAVRQGEDERAQALLAESVATYEQIGEQWGVAAALGSLGWLALRQRDFARLRALLGRSMALRQEIGELGGIAWCLEKCGAALWHEAQARPAALRRPVAGQAVTVLGAAAALRASLDSVIDPADQPAHAGMLRELRRMLGETAFAAAWAQGEAMPLPEAMDLAVRPPAEPPAETQTGEAGRRARFGGLTPRERETAVLVAQGLSNRAIAAQMVVREKTIETYITRILNKLGFDSRVQIATWAVQSGLADADDDAARE